MLNEFKLKDNVILRNRVVVAPMTTWAANKDLTVSDQEAEYYAERSAEAGMVITGCTFFEPDGQGFDNEFYAGSDDYIPSLRKMADAIKSGGSKAILQIFHAGRMAMPGKGPLKSASAVKPTHNAFGMEVDIDTPEEMSAEEIETFIEGFGEATRRAIEAGFDGIEIHGANTFLIQQFYSGDSNRREDQWGGSRETRLNFPLALIKAANKAKKKHGDESFIIGYRFSPEEIEPKGITLDDTLHLVDRLADEEVDYLHASLGHYRQTSMRDKDDKRIVGKLIAEKINGRKPFIGVGKIATKEDAEDAMTNVGYDMVALGHAMVTDPQWVSKVRNDREVERFIDPDSYREKKIPDGLMSAIKSMPGWFEVK